MSLNLAITSMAGTDFPSSVRSPGGRRGVGSPTRAREKVLEG